MNAEQHPLTRKLRSQSLALSQDEEAALLNLPMQVETIRADQDIVREGDRPSRSCLILEGFAATYKVTPTGKRQIVNFSIPATSPICKAPNSKFSIRAWAR